MKVYGVKIEYSRFRNEAALTTRDIRALVLRFIPEKSEYFQILNWHEKDTPRVIYVKPRNNYAVVYTAISDTAEYLVYKIERRFIRLDGKRVSVKSAKLYETVWKIEKTPGMNMYHTRTDIVTAVNDPEWHINTAVKYKNSSENLENDVLKNIITRTVKHTYRNWFGFEPNLSGLQIKIIDGKHVLDYGYKDGIRFPVWNGYFLTNYRLPPFVGYKIGLGKGELEIKAVLSEEKAKKLLV